MRIINVPIEPIPMRYSADWNSWFPEQFEREGISHISINPVPMKLEIEKGSFLDVCGTNYYKARQMQMIAENLDRGWVSDEDVFFFHDLWNPTVCQLAYMRDGLGKKFKIAGVLHAGCWDREDFLCKKGMAEWALPLEHSIFKIADVVFVGTQFHKELILRNRGALGVEGKIKVTGLPLYPIEGFYEERIPGRIVFPHRLDSEKNPEYFNLLVKELERRRGGDISFVLTAEKCRTKEDYYRELAKAEYSVSFAEQETWGYAMMESVLLGCVPIVPNRLSYSELYPKEVKFNSSSGRETLIMNAFNLISKFLSEGNPNIESLQRRLLLNGKLAIPNMISHMYDLFN